MNADGFALRAALKVANGQFLGRSVAVTGAGGSIGSEICRALLAGGASRLVLISLTEAGLYNIERRIRSEFYVPPLAEIVPVLGSVEDARLMRSALAGCDLVVHAAAHKHLPLCESNPCAAVRNNVWGTRQLLEAATHMGVRWFCFISTDKAVKPTSVMGATKRLAEILVRQADCYSPLNTFIVRFGNVLDSAGSVLPLWREQIAAGGPITLTDDRCERFFMSIPQAAMLVCSVAGLQHSGTYVLDMGAPVRLVDLARKLIAESGREIEIKLTGLRPGEKLTEELHYGGELEPTEVAGVSRISDFLHGYIDPATVQALNANAIGGHRDVVLKSLWSLVA